MRKSCSGSSRITLARPLDLRGNIRLCWLRRPIFRTCWQLQSLIQPCLFIVVSPTNLHLGLVIKPNVSGQERYSPNPSFRSTKFMKGRVWHSLCLLRRYGLLRMEFLRSLFVLRRRHFKLSVQLSCHIRRKYSSILLRIRSQDLRKDVATQAQWPLSLNHCTTRAWQLERAPE